jgi:hypothetical protein
VASVSWNTFGPLTTVPNDVLSLRISARIGTNENDSKCPGHNSAVGLRFYYDGNTTPSQFDTTFRDSNDNWYLHSNGTACGNSQSSGVTNRVFDHLAPNTSPKCQDPAALKFTGGNAFQTIGSWSTTVP